MNMLILRLSITILYCRLYRRVWGWETFLWQYTDDVWDTSPVYTITIIRMYVQAGTEPCEVYDGSGCYVGVPFPDRSGGRPKNDRRGNTPRRLRWRRRYGSSVELMGWMTGTGEQAKGHARWDKVRLDVTACPRSLRAPANYPRII